MFRNVFDGWHIVILALVIVVVFGWKRLPDAARSLGRSMRIFKSEVSEMKTDGKPASAAGADTVRGDVVPPVEDTSPVQTSPVQTSPVQTSPVQPSFVESPVRETTPAPVPQNQQHSA